MIDVENLKMRFFIKSANGNVKPSDLEISWPERIPIKGSDEVIFQSTATFPGVLPDDGQWSRRESGLHAMVEILQSVKQFCIDFEKRGGVLYFSMPEDESKPFLGEPVKAKRFFA